MFTNAPRLVKSVNIFFCEQFPIYGKLSLLKQSISEVCAHCGFMLIADCISACNSLNRCFYRIT